MAEYKYAPLYVGAKKCGEIESLKLTFMSNGEQIVIQDEVAESTGVITSEGTFDTVIAVGGMSVDLVDLQLKQTQVEVGVQMNAKFYRVAGKIIKTDMSSTVKTGVTKGNFAFRGGTPKAI